MNERGEWSSWVGPARAGNPEAIHKLGLYFSPFVHAVALARLPHPHCPRVVKSVMAQAILRISSVTDDSGFAGFLLAAAREKSTESARAQAAVNERPTSDPLINEALVLVGKIRQLAEGPRELLLMRLLEGIAGVEIAQILGGDPSQVRTDLEQASAALVQQLTAKPVSFTGDEYLWSLAGTPPPGLIPLENQLTALRYDPSAIADLDLSQPNWPALRKPGGELRPPPISAEAGALEKTDPTPLQNPFPATVKTIGVTNLPAAADFADLQPTASGSPLGAGDEDLPTLANPSVPTPIARESPSKSAAPLDDTGPTTIQPSGPRKPLSKEEDPDITVPRAVPLSTGEEPGPTRSVQVPAPGAWRESNLLAPPASERPMDELDRQVVLSLRPFVIALALALIAGGVAWLLFDSSSQRLRAGWTLVPVIVASVEINEGAKISDEMLSQRAVPEQFVTSSVIKPESLQYVIGQKLRVAVQAGDPLLWSQFESARTTERLSKKVLHHARAFDLMTTRLIAVGGWVQPDDHVDIIASLRANPNDLDRTAITVLQDVTVLTTGKLTSSTPESVAKTKGRDYVDVSLLLLPEEAEIIALVDQLAELQLTLRTEGDTELLTDHRGSNSKTLLEGERVRLLQVKRFNTIQQIRNAKPE